MRIVSLFSGIGGFEVGIKKSVLNGEVVFSSEIDPHATASYLSNFADNNLRGQTKWLEDYNSSKSRVAVTVGMMTTGYDCQDILNIGLFRPIFSATDFIQIKGRGTRTYTFKDIDAVQGIFVAKLTKMQELNHVENVTIDMDTLELDTIYSYSNTKVWQIKHGDTDITNKVNIKIENDKYVFTGLKEYLDDTITFTCHATLENSGNYRVEGRYNNLTQTSSNQSISYNINVLGSILPKEYFTLRLEDGSDVKYNSLMITEGDDLLTPITYTSEKIEDYTDDMVIIGEKKRIPVGETQYIKFNIT